MTLFIGTAGWTVPKQHKALFSAPTGSAKPSHLELYASRLRCVEINSSFYRPHRRATWERWAATTPPHFRFAVKAPKAITHTAKLVNTGRALQEFFASASALGDKLGPILVQFPPTLSFDEATAYDFFTTLRELHPGAVVLEPRHPSWFTLSADQLLQSFQIARVAADPPKGPEVAAQPGGYPGLSYWRLHGSPRTYYSNYEEGWLQVFAKQPEFLDARSSDKQIWIIFDNTALGCAVANAVSLELLSCH